MIGVAGPMGEALESEEAGEYVSVAGIRVDAGLHRFVGDELLPGSGTEAAAFWAGLARLIERFAARNAELLGFRERLQGRIDGWHRDNPQFDVVAYTQFLREIGYLVPAGEPFGIGTANVDPEIATMAGRRIRSPIL